MKSPYIIQVIPIIIIFLLYISRIRNTEPRCNCPTLSEINQTKLQSSGLEHRCIQQRIPYVSSLLETAEYLDHHRNVSFIRFGDADFDLMMGKSTKYQTVSPELSQALFKCLTVDVPNIAIGLPDIFSGVPPANVPTISFWSNHDYYRTFILRSVRRDKRFFQTWITQLGPATFQTSSCSIMYTTIFDTLRNIWRDRTILLVRGNNTQVYQHDVFDTARRMDTIYAPRTEAWAAYSKLKKEILGRRPYDLYIFTCGAVGKVLTYDLAMRGYTALDLGHIQKDYDRAYGNHSLYAFYQD